MSFSSDRASLDALCGAIFHHRLTVDVQFEDGEVIASVLTDAAAVFEAASATSDPVLLVLRREGLKDGVFLVLLQDDPDCLVVDHSTNILCQSIFDVWFARAEEAV
jgi:hypothetical protein